MRNYTEDMHQPASYWAPGAPDGFGGVSHGAPEPLSVRWQDQAVLFRDGNGQEVMSSAVVYVPRPLVLDGYLALGTFTGEPAAAGARQIRQAGTTPDLDAGEQLSKVWL